MREWYEGGGGMMGRPSYEISNHPGDGLTPDIIWIKCTRFSQENRSKGQF